MPPDPHENAPGVWGNDRGGNESRRQNKSAYIWSELSTAGAKATAAADVQRDFFNNLNLAPKADECSNAAILRAQIGFERFIQALGHGGPRGVGLRAVVAFWIVQAYPCESYTLTELAKALGVTRAATSKIAIEICRAWEMKPGSVPGLRAVETKEIPRRERLRRARDERECDLKKAIALRDRSEPGSDEHAIAIRELRLIREKQARFEPMIGGTSWTG